LIGSVLPRRTLVAKWLAFDEDHGPRIRLAKDSENGCSNLGGLAMAERSKYQQKIIKNYYNNQEAISLQRLSELVTELYLAEGKKRAQHWKGIVGALEKLKVPKSRIDHLVEQDNPTLLAKLVEELLAKK